MNLGNLLAAFSLSTKFKVEEYNNLGNPQQTLLAFLVLSTNVDQVEQQINFGNL